LKSILTPLWVGPALVLVTWRLFSTVSTSERAILYLSLSVLTVLLCLLNESLAALLAVPVIFLSIQLCQGAQLPRMKWFFYGFYPVHLLALKLVKKLAVL